MINRRQFLETTLAAGAAAAAGCSPAPATRDTRPNVISISVDDMNDWVGCLQGYPGVHTPNIDALAKRGVLFTDAHCTSPICNPSRTSIMTGKRPSTTGIYDNDQFWKPHLPDAVTMPMFFKQNGYLTAGAGKIFHHNSGFNPPDQWDEYRMQQFDDPWYRRPDWYDWEERMPNPPGHPFNGMAGDNFAGEFDFGVLPGRPERTYGDMTAVRYAEDFLRREHTKPFFLAIGLWHPHIPMFSPQKYFDQYPIEDVKIPEVPADDLDDLPPIAQEIAAVRRDEHERLVKEGKWDDAVQAYLAAITFADEMVGQILKAVDESDQADNTIIVFWSDHGWHLGEKLHWHKSTLWERATHVPMIWKGPGIERNGEDRAQQIELVDMYPTLAELCGLDASEVGLDGISLVPQLKDPAAAKRPAVIDYMPGNYAVLTEKWRYIRYHDGTEELYDRLEDPNDWHNLAGLAEHDALKKELAEWMPKTSAPMARHKDEYEFDPATYSYKLLETSSGG